jgi:rubredoxin
MKSFQALCPTCKKTESTSFVLSPEERLLSDEQLWSLLDKRAEIKVFHTSNGPDHNWVLDKQARENALAYTKTLIRYWFAVKATFTCPNCGKLSEEVMYTNAGRSDPNRIAAAIQRQNMKCRSCKIVPTDGTHIDLNVLPITLAEAKAAGFKPDPNLGL